ncbi:MAG: hypothetical protein CL666_14645 [Balneola sp.]|nr:hypothetical protein [Balneola sp.]
MTQITDIDEPVMILNSGQEASPLETIVKCTMMKKANKAPAYAVIYNGLAEVARKHGYALAIHGSVVTDLDLIAIPWIKEADDMETLVQAIIEHCGACGINLDQYGNEQEPEEKPHGRIAWKLFMGAGGAVDLSVLPKKYT